MIATVKSLRLCLLAVVGLAACLLQAQGRSVSIVLEKGGTRRVVGEGFITASGRTLVPLRVISESLGATVDYRSGIVTIRLAGRDIVLRIGEQAMTVDGQPKSMDVAPVIYDAKTFVPLRFVAEELNAEAIPNLPTEVVVRTSVGSPGGPPVDDRPGAYSIATIPVIFDGVFTQRTKDWFATQVQSELRNMSLHVTPRTEVNQAVRAAIGRTNLTRYPGRSIMLEIRRRSGAQHLLYVRVHQSISLRQGRTEAEFALASGSAGGTVDYRGYRDTAYTFYRGGKGMEEAERYGLQEILRRLRTFLDRQIR